MENQSCVFHEDIPIPGTDLTLHYAADRTPGFKPRITIPASGPVVPDSLIKIIVKMEVAGRLFETVIDPPLADRQVEFVWDGQDYLGREMTGSTPARVQIGFEYPMEYYAGNSIFSQAFAQPGTNTTFIQARENIIAWKESVIMIDRGEADFAQGWTLSSHHLLNPGDPNTLQKGDGTRLRNNIRVVKTVATANPAANNFTSTRGVAIDKAGNIFFSDWDNFRYMKMETNGRITYYDLLNTEIGTVRPNGLALDGAGNLYFTNPETNTGDFVGKIDPAGKITIIAGNKQKGFDGDGGPATEAKLNWPEDIAVDPFGNIYITDTNNNRIRKVDPNGIITTIAGKDQRGYGGDGEAATQASLAGPRGVAVDPRGNIYIADTDNNRIRRVDPSGIITTIAGTGMAGFEGDGGPATQARVAWPRGMAFDQSGNLYIADEGNYRIRKIDTGGIISTVAGNGQRANDDGDGGPATQATIHDPRGVAVDSRGDVYVAKTGYGKIKKISMPGAFKPQDFANDIVFVDENGLGYSLSSSGRHQTTFDPITGKTLLTFGYDQAENLVSITDRFGNQTTIQRDGSGAPLSITSPDGQVTQLTVVNNQLTKIAFPDNAAYTFTYTMDGLLTEKVDPRGRRFIHQYDSGGLITSVFDPEGGNWGFSRTVDSTGNHFINIQTAEGNSTLYRDRTDFTGNYSSTKTDPSGSVSHFSQSSDELNETEQSACGLLVTSKYDLDPAYRYRYLQQITEQSPAGLSRTILGTRTYQGTNGDKIPDSITYGLSLNGRNWTSVQNTIAGTVTVTSPLGRAVTLTYSPGNLLAQNVTMVGFHPITYEYDGRGRLTGAAVGQRTMSLAYNPQGFVERIVTPDQKTMRFTYDAVGRIKDQFLPDQSVIRYDYDANGNLTVLTNPRAVSYQFGYTGVNLRRTMTKPLPGTYQYTYDKERNLKSILFPSGTQITHAYTNGLLRRTETPEGAVSFAYTCGSNLQEAARGLEKVAYTYDGSLMRTDSRSGLINQTIDYTYNNDFRLTSLTYAGVPQPLTYDLDGLLTGAGAFTITRKAQNGLPVTVSDGTMTFSRTFSGFGELDSVVYKVVGSNKYGYTLTRDLVGRITQKIETMAGETDTYGYTYDANGRLIEVQRNGSVVEGYTYDSNNNRLTETNNLRSVNRDYTVSAEDHLITAGAETYQFDADGFLVGKTAGAGPTTYQYSSRGELLSATLPGGPAITYDHDPLGRRIARKVNGTITEKYLWKDAVTLLAVYDASNNLRLRFNYADDRLPVSMTYNGSFYYLAFDQIGSLKAVINTSGNIVKKIDYDSFGSIVSDTDPTMNIPLGFAGGLHDRQTGLVRFGARDYDPAIGRWTAKDPIDFAGGDANLYGYVLNDPVNWVDPKGLWGEDVHSGINNPFYGTYKWALEENFSKYTALKISLANKNADSFYNYLPIVGTPSRHFNTGGSSMIYGKLSRNKTYR